MSIKKNIVIPARIKLEIDMLIASEIVIDNWIDMKKYLLKSIPPKSRKIFSTRDQYTKKQSVNDIELKIINYYQSNSGCMINGVPNE